MSAWTRVAMTSLVVPALRSGIAAQTSEGRLREFLAREAGFAAAQLEAVDRGDIAVRTLPTGDDRDVAVMGIVRVDGARRLVIDGLRDRRETHVFGTPAAVGDVDALRLTSDDLNELARCEPNACNFKLPAAGMAVLSSIANTRTADASARATDYLRRRMVEYVSAYRQRGNAAMIAYDDLGSVQSSASFGAMLRDSSRIFRVAPALAAFLLDYPRASLPDASSVIYWSVETLPRVRPVLRIMHEVTFTPIEVPGATVIAKKQLYADHYFEAGLETAIAIEDSLSGFVGGAHQTAVVVVRQYRFDHLPNGRPLNLRGRVIDGLRDALVTDLRKLRGADAR